MKKIISILVLIMITLSNAFVFSNNLALAETKLYYLDSDNNAKIDLLEIEFNNELTGALNLDKLFLYSNTWWLSSSKLDSVYGAEIFASYYLSWNILWIKLKEQDNFGTGLTINNTTASNLRLKTNAWVGIMDLSGTEIKLLYTSSFINYTDVSFKPTQVQNIIPDTTNELTIDPSTLPETSTWWAIGNAIDIIEETWAINIDSSLINTTINNLNINQDIISTWSTNNFSYETDILFQSPSYLLEKDDSESTIFNCDRTKTDCKVNFNLNIDFWSWFVSVPSDYECNWGFWFSWADLEEHKCNPNTIVYPIWEWETSYKILEKANPSNYVEKKIKIKNEWFKDDSITKIIYVSSTISQNTNQGIYIDSPKINIQGGLDENNNCKKSDCNINLSYDIKNTKEACLWSFPGWVYTVWTDIKCNPGYIKYQAWDFRATLRVYEMWNESNYRESYINFSNKIKDEKLEIINSKEDNFEKGLANIKELENISSLSGILKISQILPNPIWNDDLEWIELENRWDDKINLKWCEIQNELKSSTKKYKIETDTFLNPKEVLKFYKIDTDFSVKNTGGRKINFLCDWVIIDNMTWIMNTPEGFVIDSKILKWNIISIEKWKDKNQFIVNFSDWESLITEKYNNRLVGDLLKQVNSDNNIQANSKIKDFLKNSFVQKVSKQKKWVKIYGSTISNAKVMIQIKKTVEKTTSFLDFFFNRTYADSLDTYEIVADNDGKYELFIKNPSIWEFEVKSAIKSEEGYNLEMPKVTNFDVDKDYIDYIDTNKDIKTINMTNDLEAIIEVQWKISADKFLSKNRIICYSDECSVNFDWRTSKWEKGLQYIWDFWNGKSFDKANPASYVFSKWKHIISLKVKSWKSENISYFIVEVLGKIPKKSQKKNDDIIEENSPIFPETANASNNDTINSKWNSDKIIYISLLIFLTIGLFVFILRKRTIS